MIHYFQLYNKRNEITKHSVHIRSHLIYGKVVALKELCGRLWYRNDHHKSGRVGRHVVLVGTIGNFGNFWCTIAIAVRGHLIRVIPRSLQIHIHLGLWIYLVKKME